MYNNIIIILTKKISIGYYTTRKIFFHCSFKETVNFALTIVFVTPVETKLSLFHYNSIP